MIGTMTIHDVAPSHITHKYHPAQGSKDMDIHKEQPPSDSISNRLNADVICAEEANIIPNIPAISPHVKMQLKKTQMC